MKKLLLYLPMLILGLPLLAMLLLAAASKGEKKATPVKKAVVPGVLGDEKRLADAGDMAKLAKEEPVRFLENCLARYRRDVQGYQCTMQKQERLKGKLWPKETIEVFFKEKPHSVLMRWLGGARKAERALYVEGENDGKMLARPNGVLARKIVGDVVVREVDGDDARQSGRYTLKEFGIKKGTERTLAAWQASRDRGQLRVEYLGETKVREAGDRLCYKLRRTYEAPENDGVTQLTIYVDKETWLQVGSTLKGEESKLIGEYFFRDISINPKSDPELFHRQALVAEAP
jgi:hypothetical protein